MNPYHKNPRQITEKQFNNLCQTLDELGDVSGIVHDLNSDEIIGGNQRGRVFDLFNGDCEIVIEHRLEQPDRQDTVALGYILWNGAKYQYRQVAWTPEQCEQANIVANKAGGGWDFDILANEFELPDLLEWGFEPFELGGINEDLSQVKFKEYDESVAGEVEFIECPSCGHRFPK